ncbi:MAG: hypothetical protein U0R51_02265 [Solirubrobacterales bacterium]
MSVALVALAIGGAVVLSIAEGDEGGSSSKRVVSTVERSVGWRFAARISREGPSTVRVTIRGDRIDGHKRVGFFRPHLLTIPRTRFPFSPLRKQSDLGQLGPGHPTRSFAFRYSGGPPMPPVERFVFEANAGATPFPVVRFGLPGE